MGPASLRADLFAGLAGATLALPQGVAFAAIAGLPPEYGFYSAMITPVVAALFGSSWHAVSGPTTAISALVFGAIAGLHAPGSPEFIQAAITLALFVGLFQLALGLARLGNLVDFVSHSVMAGFVTGAVLLIALSQIQHALGLDLPRPEHLTEFATALWHALPDTHGPSALIAATAFTVGFVVRWWKPLAPNYLIALSDSTGLSLVIAAPGEVVTIGHLETVIPGFALPETSYGSVRELASASIAIGLVGIFGGDVDRARYR